MTLQTTYILKNLTDDTIAEIATLPSIAAYDKLTNWAFGDLKHCVTQKCGSGQFRDRVEWNQIMRAVTQGAKTLSHKTESRRGYKLVTFTA